MRGRKKKKGRSRWDPQGQKWEKVRLETLDRGEEKSVFGVFCGKGTPTEEEDDSTSKRGDRKGEREVKRVDLSRQPE